MKIESYSFGNIKVDGKNYKSDLIIFPHKVYNNWWRKQGHSLTYNDLEEVINYNPELLIIGTGKFGLMNVPEDLKNKLKNKGIEVIVTKTEQAVKEFNTREGKKVAALHLSC